MFNNLSKISLLSLLCSTSFLLPKIILAYELPEMGSQTQQTISYQDEHLIGEQIYQDIQNNLPISNNPYIENYLQKLGTKLLNNSNKHFDRFEFFVVNSSDINAFALPGGFIGVNRGLITTAENESELAAVLSHEITHVNQRHIARSIEKQKQMRLPMIVGLLAGAIVSAYSPEAGQSIIAGTMAAGNQSLINYTRENEEEADRIGMQILVNSNYSPYSMGNFFNKMQRNLYADNDNFPEYLRTHPVNSSRIADANSRADKIILNSKNGIKTNKLESNKDKLDFLIVKSMLLIDNTDNLEKVITSNKNALQEDHNKPEDNIYKFNIAYAMLKKQDVKNASLILQKLYEEFPQNNIISGLYAETLKNDYQSAVAIINKQIAIAKNNIPLITLHAKLAINNGRSEEAVKILKKFILDNSYYPAMINLLLAEAYNKLNQKWQASIAYADYSVKKGDFEAAIMQLKSCQKFDKLSQYQQKILAYRLKDLQAKQKDRKERLKAWA